MRRAMLCGVAFLTVGGTCLPTARGTESPPAEAALAIVGTTAITGAGDNVKPFVVARPRGGAYMVWARRDGDRSAVFFARSDDGRKFGAPVRLSAESMSLDLGAESGPHMTLDERGTLYVVWAAGDRRLERQVESSKLKVESGQGRTPNLEPSTLNLQHAGGHGGARPPRPGNLAIYLAKSTDDGHTFSAPRRVSDGPDGPDRRFPAVAVDGHGAVHVAWLDKRQETPERPGFSRVYSARSTDGGETFSPNVDITQRQENSICHCCKPAIAIHPASGVFVAYRNEIDDLRDIFCVRCEEDCGSLSAPTAVEDTQWILPACPMNGPSLACDAVGNVHAVWCTGGKVEAAPLFPKNAGSRIKVMYRRFDAAKDAWDAPVCLGSGTHPRVAIGPGGAPFITWTSESIMLAQLTPDGRRASAALPVSRTPRAGAYPSLAVTADGEVFVAWQERAEDDSWRVHLARVR